MPKPTTPSNDRTGVTYDLPLKAPLDLTGPLSARLFVSTTGADAFVTLRVEDVDPATGAANEITAGWDTLSFRALDPQRTERLGTAGQLPFHPYTKDSVQEVKAGAVYDWSVELRPIAARVAAGHVLRLSIQTSDVVRFVPNGPALARTTGSVVSIHHDDQRPSALIIPVTR